MASNISDDIEKFILSVIGDEDSLKLSRNDLANYFSVAPSQINYVLTTRFGLDKGYVIESKRGGGGCITIVRLTAGPDEAIPMILKELDEMKILSFNKACNYLNRLEREKIINNDESAIIKSAISDRALAVPLKSDGLRKNVFKEILIGLMRR